MVVTHYYWVVSSGGRFVRLPYAWRAIVEVGPPAPAAYLANLMTQALRYGLPTARRFGRVKGVLGRRGLPQVALSHAVKLGIRRAEPELDDFRLRLARQWDRLHTEQPCPVFEGMLVLERAAARTFFLFAGDLHPIVVCKIPRGSSSAIEREAAALERAAGSGVAPRFLGIAAGSWVQEGMAGVPVRVEPLEPARMKALRWPGELDELARGFIRLAERSAQPVGIGEPIRPLMERASSCASLARSTRERVTRAIGDLDGIRRTVLKHSDTSPQNCLFHEGRLSGVVDWEMAELEGIPGSDILNAAVSYMEHGIGLARWSEENVLDSFRAGWTDSPFFAHARTRARSAVVAAGIDEGLADSLEVTFFARRLGRRLVSPDGFPTGSETAARMLEIVCGS